MSDEQGQAIVNDFVTTAINTLDDMRGDSRIRIVVIAFTPEGHAAAGFNMPPDTAMKAVRAWLDGHSDNPAEIKPFEKETRQ